MSAPLVRTVLRAINAADRKVIAEEAAVAWLDTIVPESRAGVFEAWVKCIRWRLDCPTKLPAQQPKGRSNAVLDH